MILLDTNIVSQSMKPDGDMNVRSWLDSQLKSDLYLCAPVLAELYYGAKILPEGGKRNFLLAACGQVENEIFAGRILMFDRIAARYHADLRAMRQKMGKPLPVMDAVIASIASAHSMTLATRNIRDFEGLGLSLVNPYSLQEKA
jgi:toxin FitB